MILPTTSASALILLLVSFVCLGSWINTFKLTGTRWRFELFYLDFAIGAVLLSLIAAFTLGTMGSDLAFSDRMLVSGRTAQGMVVLGGFVFNLGNMLLVAAAALLGISGAFPLSIGLGLLVTSFFNFQAGNVIALTSGMVLMIVAVLLNWTACRLRNTEKGKGRRTKKGLVIGVIAGIALGLFYPVVARGMTGEFSVGPYAGLLLFSIGILFSTVIYSFYFLNIAIEGGPIGFSAYFRGRPQQHLLGFGGGALWAAGTLAALLANTVDPLLDWHPSLNLILPLASVLLVIIWGTIGWKEFTTAPKNAKVALALTAAFFTGSLILVGIGITS
jgi:glucose uptake protein